MKKIIQNTSNIIKNIKPATWEQINKLPSSLFVEQPYLADSLLKGEVDIKPLLKEFAPKTSLKNAKVDKLDKKNDQSIAKG